MWMLEFGFVLIALGPAAAAAAAASSEDVVVVSKCAGTQFMRCENGIGCVHKRWWCDGRADCADRSDESPRICSTRSRQLYQAPTGKHVGVSGERCPNPWFFCRDASACVEPARVCDRRKDCRDGSDESNFCHMVHVSQHRTEADKIVH